MADIQLHDYDTIVAPHITEKASFASEQNKIMFKVKIDATKPQVKSAVENLFKVDVTKVNIIRVKGKVKTFRGRLGKQSDWKKAVVTLKDGQAVDMTTGL